MQKEILKKVHNLYKAIDRAIFSYLWMGSWWWTSILSFKAMLRYKLYSHVARKTLTKLPKTNKGYNSWKKWTGVICLESWQVGITVITHVKFQFNIAIGYKGMCCRVVARKTLTKLPKSNKGHNSWKKWTRVIYLGSWHHCEHLCKVSIQYRHRLQRNKLDSSCMQNFNLKA